MLGILELVQLGHDPCGQAGGVIGDFALDQADELGSHVHRCDDQRLELRGARPAGQEVEQGDDVARDCRVRGQQPDVFVEPGRARVIVPRADVSVGADTALLLADHERCFAVGLEPAHPEHDVRPDLLELA